MAEFRDKKQAFIDEIHWYFNSLHVANKNRHSAQTKSFPKKLNRPRWCWTAEEQQIFIGSFKVDSVWWGTPISI